AALFARDVAAIAKSSLQIAREEEERARLRHEVGTGTEVTLAQARVRRAGLEAQLFRAENDLERYQTQLASLIGETGKFEVQGDLEVLSSTAASSRETIERAPALVRLRAMQAASWSSARAKSRSILPTVNAFGKAEVTYPRNLELELGPVFSA